MSRYSIKTLLLTGLAILFFLPAKAQKSTPGADIPVVGVVKNIPDSVLLDIVQRQTFRFFWNHAHPVSGLARERSDTVMAVHYWDYIN